MQILESSLIGLRSARLSLASPNGDVSVTLFPMVHIGEPSFYEAVFAEALGHDVVFLEGVDSRVSRRITRAYRWIGDSIPGLIIQPRFPRTNDGGALLVHADLSGEEFEREWRKVPFPLQLLVYAAAPICGLKHRWQASRRALAEGHSFNDLTSRNEILDWDPSYSTLGQAIVDARDRRLLERIREQIQPSPSTPKRLAVVYGAQHMRAVLRMLQREFSYHVTDADWMVVFRV